MPEDDPSYDHRVRVRYAETDQMGVVHHANYVLYLEEARTAWMAALGVPYGQLEREGVGLAVRKVDLRYHESALYEDDLLVRTRLERLRGASVVFAYEVLRERDSALLVRASTDLACIDLQGGRGPRPLPEHVREVMAGVALG